MAKSEWVFDQLLCFLGDPFFQAPVNTFMDANCLIFDPQEELSEYKTIHEGYRKLVTAILEGFRQDSGLSHEEIVKKLSDMNKKPDLREVFKNVFEQVLAAESYSLFRHLMRQRNLELQQQAMMLLMKQYGQLPESLIPVVDDSNSTKGGGDKTDPAAPDGGKNSEHLVLVAVLNEPDLPAEKSTAEAKKVVEVIQKEAVALENIKQKETAAVQQAMKDLVIDDKAKSETKPPPAAAKPVAAPAKQPAPKIAVTRSEGVSGEDAANKWLQSALSESESKDSNTALQKAVEAFQQLSPEELERRQKFLQEQRAKLVARKQKEREKQLITHEKSQTGSSRPKSARVARSAMTGEVTSAEDEKKLAMRKAIAARLRSEVVGKKD